MHVQVSFKSCLLVLCVVPLLAGCGGTRLFRWIGEKEIPTADANNPVTRVVCIWESSEGRGVDGLPTRGFAGQVMFFTHRDPSPVMVEGDVRIYLFDDQGTPDEQGRPIHQFDFRKNEHGNTWNRHLAIGSLGPWYQLFIPYTRKGHDQARCALQVRFSPAAGGTVFSDMATVVLPGKLGANTDDASAPLPRYKESEADTATAAAVLPTRQLGQRMGLVERATPGRSGPARVYADTTLDSGGRHQPVESGWGSQHPLDRERPVGMDGRIHLAAATIDPRDQFQQQPVAGDSTLSQSRLDRIERMLEELAAAQQRESGGGSEPRRISRSVQSAAGAVEPAPESRAFSPTDGRRDETPGRLNPAATGHFMRQVPVAQPRVPRFQSAPATGFRPTPVDDGGQPAPTEYHPLGGSHPLSSHW